MLLGVRRGVTRNYVRLLIAATLISVMSAQIAVWGTLALWLGYQPVRNPHLPSWYVAPVIALAVSVLAVLLWRQAVYLLRGNLTPSWGIVVAAAGTAYLIWALCGTLAGLSIVETWFSPFAATLFPIWAAGVLGFWFVLARRVYTDRPAPSWPWEKHQEDE